MFSFFIVGSVLGGELVPREIHVDECDDGQVCFVTTFFKMIWIKIYVFGSWPEFRQLFYTQNMGPKGWIFIYLR